MYQATGAGKFKLTAKETLDFVLRELLSPQGAFYSAQDADSEGEEGKFYLWTMEEVMDVLEPADADLAVHLFGLTIEGIYFAASSGKPNGRNILHLAEPLDQVASAKGLTLDELIMRMGKIRNALFEARKKRTPPATDEKILTDWNGLMIAALARAGQVFGEERFLQAAVKAAEFFLRQMQAENGTLYHRFAMGERAVEGFLDDYAFLAFGLLELYEAAFEEKYLRAASALTKEAAARFGDEKNGGFFFTQQESQVPVPRFKQVYDGAVPSGNSVALLNLLRLSRLQNDAGYEEMAAKLVQAFAVEVQSVPEAFTWLLSGVDFAVGPSYSVLLVGLFKEAGMRDMVAALRKHYLPNATIAVKTPQEAGFGFEQANGKATAQVCRGQTCLPPTSDVKKMLELLGVARTKTVNSSKATGLA
jgi:uncharacterized protein YyaL (SSP411 family)